MKRSFCNYRKIVSEFGKSVLIYEKVVPGYGKSVFDLWKNRS
jgi:hypothetical protein